MTSTRRKVTIFSSVHRWNDTRILLKQAVSLQKRYDVELFAPADFTEKSYQDIRIIGLPTWERVSDRRIIRRQLKKILATSDADIFHFHDPELIPMGLWLRQKKRKPVIYDIHEDYAAYILDKEWIPQLLRVPISRTFKLIETIAVKYFDHNITATNAILDALPVGCNASTISNYPIILPSENNGPKTREELRFLYLGSMEEIRGIYNMMEAFRQFRKNIPSDIGVTLHIAGKLIGSEKYQNSLRHLIQHPDIIYHGQVPFTEGQMLMDSCHVGIIPFFPLPNHVDAVPNKLFEYMSNGLYLLVSNFQLWDDIVVKNGVGESFNPLDIGSIQQAMAKCLSSFDHIIENADVSRRLVQTKYRWASEEEKLFQIYQELL